MVQIDPGDITINQKGEHMDGSENPVSDIGDGVLLLDILMIDSICFNSRLRKESNISRKPKSRSK